MATASGWLGEDPGHMVSTFHFSCTDDICVFALSFCRQPAYLPPCEYLCNWKKFCFFPLFSTSIIFSLDRSSSIDRIESNILEYFLAELFIDRVYGSNQIMHRSVNVSDKLFVINIFFFQKKIVNNNIPHSLHCSVSTFIKNFSVIYSMN